jgi:hypothetical protein
MMNFREMQIFLLLIVQTLLCESFLIRTIYHCTNSIKLRSCNNVVLRVIKAEDNDFVYDAGAGGVRLATECAIKITGSVSHRPGHADPSIKELVRYNSLISIKESTVNSVLQSMGATIICTGKGIELYKDPGKGTEAVVVLAPVDAVREALAVAGSAISASNLVINFVGGDDAQILEVIEAIKQIVLMLDIATKAKIKFNSISSPDFPLAMSSVTVIALPEESVTGGLSGIDKAIATGEIYVSDGKFWTVVDDDINNDLA